MATGTAWAKPPILAWKSATWTPPSRSWKANTGGLQAKTSPGHAEGRSSASLGQRGAVSGRSPPASTRAAVGADRVRQARPGGHPTEAWSMPAARTPTGSLTPADSDGGPLGGGGDSRSPRAGGAPPAPWGSGARTPRPAPLGRPAGDAPLAPGAVGWRG
jgi:hypothetical protein